MAQNKHGLNESDMLHFGAKSFTFIMAISHKLTNGLSSISKLENHAKTSTEYKMKNRLFQNVKYTAKKMEIRYYQEATQNSMVTLKA